MPGRTASTDQLEWVAKALGLIEPAPTQQSLGQQASTQQAPSQQGGSPNYVSPVFESDGAQSEADSEETETADLPLGSDGYVLQTASASTSGSTADATGNYVTPLLNAEDDSAPLPKDANNYVTNFTGGGTGGATSLYGSEMSQQGSSDATSSYTASTSSASSASGASQAPNPKVKKDHADPLLADPKIAALLKERDALRAKVTEVVSGDESLQQTQRDVEALAEKLDALDENAKDERSALRQQIEDSIVKETEGNAALKKLSADLDDVDAKLEKELKRLNATGVSPQKLGDEYAGEQFKLGWRASRIDDPARKKKWEESKHVRTKYYGDKERDESELTIGLDGNLRGADGLLRQGALNSSEMVINPETGKMHEFKPEKYEINETAPHPDTGKSQHVELRKHHSSVLSGKEVTGAGSFETDYQGSLTKITNQSGHYRPGVAKLIQSVETLLAQGGFLDRSWVGADLLLGRGKQLHGLVEEGAEAASVLEIKLRQATLAMTRKLDADSSYDAKDEQELIADQSGELEKLLGALHQGERALDKLGASRKNKLMGEVEYIHVTEGMTGLQAHEATTTKQRVGEFLASGGGDTGQQKKKKSALDELKKTTAAKKGSLDKEAEKSESVGSKATDKQVDDAIASLEKLLGVSASPSTADSSPSASGQQNTSVGEFSGSTGSSEGGVPFYVTGGGGNPKPDDKGSTYYT
ncbi:MAG: hypothetical protein ACRCT8_16980 [Lacipirellulaceae bacterium]